MTQPVEVVAADVPWDDTVRTVRADAGEHRISSRIAGKHAELWGADAQEEAAKRLGWLDCVSVSRPLVEPLEALRDELRAAGVDRVVLAGMGGSSLAPEVITRTAGVDLVVLDTTDPGQVRAAITDLERTVVVVSSKSGGTVETDSHRRAFHAAFDSAGIDPAQRIVVVTDPGSPLEQTAADAGYRTFLADPDVGGRYSALTAFGLVPSALAGVDVGALLDEAAAVPPTLGDDDNPGAELGIVLGSGAVAGHDKVVIADAGSGIAGFGDWAEQLIAESTGKQGKGLLPVVISSPSSPGWAPADDVQLVSLGGGDGQVRVSGPLGAQFMVWEFATALAGWVIGIDPFDQPNVQESKDNTKSLLDSSGDGPLPVGEPRFVDGAVEVYGDEELVGDATTVGMVLDRLLAGIDERGYLAVMAYLDRHADAAAAQLRDLLAARTSRPVTFGWGPRFLHSTGQFHKGGPQVGSFLQITGAVTADLDVPGRPYSFGRLQAAQALGDLQAIGRRHRPGLKLHLRDRTAGLDQIRKALG